MQEYKDGSFGQIQELEKLIKNLGPEEFHKTKCIHFGTKEELETVKNNKLKDVSFQDINNNIDNLEKKINKILLHLGLEKDKILIVD